MSRNPIQIIRYGGNIRNIRKIMDICQNKKEGEIIWISI